MPPVRLVSLGSGGSIDEHAAASVADSLKQGGVIICPTDTLYGLVCDANCAAALERVLSIKGRAPSSPVPVAVGSPAQAAEVAVKVTPEAALLMKHFWPGGLTLLLPGRKGLHPAVGGGGKVGVRQPHHPAVQALLEAVARPLVITSANLSGGPEPASAADVPDAVRKAVDFVLCGGPEPTGIASTVVDLCEGPPRIVRPGAIETERIRLALGMAIL